MKPSAPRYPVRVPMKSMTRVATAVTSRTTSQPPKSNPQLGAPVVRATDVGSRASSANPVSAPATTPMVRPVDNCRHWDGVMRRR